MTTFLWLCFSALVIWALMNPSRTANFIIAVGKKVLPSYHAEPVELADTRKASKLKERPDYIRKDRTAEATKRREWEYDFAALQIKASQNKGNK